MKKKILNKKKNQYIIYLIRIKLQNIILKKVTKILFLIILIIVNFYFEHLYFNRGIIIDINRINYIHKMLTKIIDNVTLVTGYFNIPSKHSISEYEKWISYFLQINHPMIFFVDNKYYKKIISKRPIEYKNKTIWIKTDISDFYSYKKFFNEFNMTYEIDIEKQIHSVPLYLVWAEKINFLKIAADKNYFNSKCFYWIDSGCFRSTESIKNFINDWPSSEKCFEDGRILISEVLKHSDNFYKKYINFDIESHKFMQKSLNVDGSCFGGQKEYIYKFYNLYYDLLIKFIKHGIFIGKDQNLFAYIAYSNQDIIKKVTLGDFFRLREYILKNG